MQRNLAKNYNIPITIFKDRRQYVAYTPVLDLSSCGKTQAEAKRMFLEAVEAFFEELERMGTLSSVSNTLKC